MFTTIQKLRASTALQDRVTKVENYLKKNYPGYEPSDKFPIFLILESNGHDDYQWVMDHKSVHVTWPEVAKPLMEGLTLEGRAANATSYMNWLESEAAKHNNKGRTITDFKQRYNGIKAQVDAAKPAAKTPAVKTAAKTPVAKKAVAKKAAAKTPVAKKAVAKKAATKTAAVKTPVAKKAATKTPVAKKVVAKKAAPTVPSTVLPVATAWPFPISKPEETVSQLKAAVEIPTTSNVDVEQIQESKELLKDNLITGAHHIALGNLMRIHNLSSAEVSQELTGKFQDAYMEYMKASGLAVEVIQSYVKAFMNHFGRLMNMSASLKKFENEQQNQESNDKQQNAATFAASWPFNLNAEDKPQ